MKVYIVLFKYHEHRLDEDLCCKDITEIEGVFSEESSAKAYCAIKNEGQDDTCYTYSERELGMTLGLTEEQYRKFINPNVSKEDFKQPFQQC